MTIFDEARGFIKEKRYVKISENMFDVGTNNVMLQKKSGRSVLLCSCSGSGMFADSNLCSHKILTITMIMNERLYQEIDNAIVQVQKYKELKLPMSNALCLDILEKIRGAK